MALMMWHRISMVVIVVNYGRNGLLIRWSNTTRSMSGRGMVDGRAVTARLLTTGWRIVICGRLSGLSRWSLLALLFTIMLMR